MSLKGKKVNEYTKKFTNGKVGYVNVYEVSGTPEELEQYKASQAERLDKVIDPETGKLLFFSANASGDQNIDININPRNGQARENDMFRNAVTKEMVRMQAFGDDAKQAFVNEFAKASVTNLFASRRTASAGSIVTPVAQAEPKAVVSTPVATAVDDLDDQP